MARIFVGIGVSNLRNAIAVAAGEVRFVGEVDASEDRTIKKPPSSGSTMMITASYKTIQSTSSPFVIEAASPAWHEPWR